MSQIGSTYAQALYSLIKDEGDTGSVLQQLTALEESFRAELEEMLYTFFTGSLF